mmetsp:Transcript_17512/g.41225  ORF Transcript_17512/g.41225 Transcript_17512/m.41225 type:complete len:216 (-) Transcript_17512:74-721(-)
MVLKKLRCASIVPNWTPRGRSTLLVAGITKTNGARRRNPSQRRKKIRREKRTRKRRKRRRKKRSARKTTMTTLIRAPSGNTNLLVTIQIRAPATHHLTGRRNVGRANLRMPSRVRRVVRFAFPHFSKVKTSSSKTPPKLFPQLALYFYLDCNFADVVPKGLPSRAVRLCVFNHVYNTPNCAPVGNALRLRGGGGETETETEPDSRQETTRMRPEL